MPDIVKVQAKRTSTGTVYYIHLPDEWVKKLNIKKGDYLEWEIDRRNRLILKKLK